MAYDRLTKCLVGGKRQGDADRRYKDRTNFTRHDTPTDSEVKEQHASAY